MKKYLPLFLLLLFLGGCNDQEKKNTDPDQRMEDRGISDTSTDAEDAPILEESATERDGVVAGEEPIEPMGEDDTVNRSENNDLSGRYIRVDNEGGSSCNCNCIEISYTAPTELCLSDSIYISARYQKGEGNSVNVFLEEVVREEGEDREIPWDDFDRKTPIATASIQPDNSLKLDWIGFSIDGELAVDYAIFGKKALEGNYKRR